MTHKSEKTFTFLQGDSLAVCKIELILAITQFKQLFMLLVQLKQIRRILTALFLKIVYY